MAKKPIKLFVHHGYDHVESGPALPAGTHRGRKLFRLLFIPFEYATPTYGDIVVGVRDPEFENNWAFEVPGKGGMPVAQLHEHGGRYAMVVKFVRGGTHRGAWFPDRSDIMSSLAVTGSDDGEKPGLVYFAVPAAVRPPAVMALLAASHPAFTFTQLHPKPRARRRAKRRRAN